MSERPKEHGWKPCVAQATGGSNPPLSEEKKLDKGKLCHIRSLHESGVRKPTVKL